MRFTKSHLLGVEVDNVTTEQFLDALDEFIREGTPHQVAYVNVDSINRAFLDRKYREILDTCDLVYPDGMGVVYASWVFGHSLKERVTAGDLIPALCKRCVANGYRLFLLGGEPGVVEQARNELLEDYPDLQIVGARHGFFSDGDSHELIEEVRRAKPDILMVGMGVPKQEKWLRRYLNELGVPVAWGVGALFDFISGRFPRAPVWMRKLGLEWMFRLIVEPKRLWKRYLLGNFIFTFRVAFLLIADLLTAGVAWLAAYQTRVALNEWFRKEINPPMVYLEALPIILVVWLMICANLGLYRRRHDLPRFEEFKRIVQSCMMFLLCSMAIGFLMKGWDLGRSVIFLSSFYSLIGLAMTRMVFRAWEERQTRHGYGRLRTVVVGTGELAVQVKHRLEDHPALEHELVGFLTDQAAAESIEGKPILGEISSLSQIVRDQAIDQVVIASPELPRDVILNMIAETKRSGIQFQVISGMFGLISQHVNLEEINNMPVVELGTHEMSPFQLGVKRLMDIGLSLLCLVPAAIVTPFIALGIRLSARGPVIFRQERVGKDGKRFLMYKFRTMYVGVPNYEQAPTRADDPRVFPFGRFLRRTSLDEIPQLINVLIGNMSMVGPRPEMPFIVDQYDVWQRRRLLVKPGITGLWQIIGRKDLPLHANLEYDLYYVQNMSLFNDILILLKTIPVVFFCKGAY